MKRSNQRTVRTKSIILICAMLLSSILPAALALGAEEPVDNPETGKSETTIVIGNKQKENEGSTININTDGNIKNDFNNSASSKITEDNSSDGDDAQGSGDGFQSDLPPPSNNAKNNTNTIDDNQKNTISNPPDCDCATDCICATKHKNTGGENFSTENAKDDDIPQTKAQEPVRKQITKDEYDKFEDKFSSNNAVAIIAPGLTLDTSAHDGWWIHADETAPKGTLTIAYKISSEYFMVTFTITESGSHFIGDGRKSEGVNHIKIGFADAEKGEDNPVTTEPDPKDDSKKKQRDNSVKKQKPETKPEPNPGTNPGADPNQNPDPEPKPGTNPNPENDPEIDPEGNPVPNPEDDPIADPESEDSDDEENQPGAPTDDDANDTPPREARAGATNSPNSGPKTGESNNYFQVLAFVSAVMAVLSAAGLAQLRIEEVQVKNYLEKHRH